MNNNTTRTTLLTTLSLLLCYLLIVTLPSHIQSRVSNTQNDIDKLVDDTYYVGCTFVLYRNVARYERGLDNLEYVSDKCNEWF